MSKSALFKAAARKRAVVEVAGVKCNIRELTVGERIAISERYKAKEDMTVTMCMICVFGCDELKGLDPTEVSLELNDDAIQELQSAILDLSADDEEAEKN